MVAGQPLTSLFEWYSPEVPYFEAVHMLRKALLIMMATVLSTSISQALASFAVNAIFLLILYVKEPMVYYPSSFFKGRNLFLLVEMLSTCTSLVGNGATVSSPAVVTSIGLVFAIVNISFGVLLFFGYASDTKKMKHAIAPVLEAAAGSRTQSMIKIVSPAVLQVEKEWTTHLALIDGSAEGTKGRHNMVLEMNLLRSKLEMQVTEALMALNKKPSNGGSSIEPVERRAVNEYNALLKKIAQDFNCIKGTSTSQALTVESIASKGNLNRIVASLSAVDELMAELPVLFPIDAGVGSTVADVDADVLASASGEIRLGEGVQGV